MPSPSSMAVEPKDETPSVATMEEGHRRGGHKRRRLGEATQLVEGGGGGRGVEEEEEEEEAPPTCSICLQPWTCNGEHRICCIPCGHVYGRSCLEKWLVHAVLQRGTGQAKCPQCGEKFEQDLITNLHAPGINIWDGCCKNHANEVGEYYNRAYEGLKTRMESTITEQRKDLEELEVLVKSAGRQLESMESCLKTFLLSMTERMKKMATQGKNLPAMTAMDLVESMEKDVHEIVSALSGKPRSSSSYPSC